MSIKLKQQTAQLNKIFSQVKSKNFDWKSETSGGELHPQEEASNVVYEALQKYENDFGKQELKSLVQSIIIDFGLSKKFKPVQ